MTDNPSKLYRRVARRSQHRSRSLATIVTLVLMIVALAWMATESVLAALDLGPLLLAPDDVVAAVETPTAITLGIAAALAAAGVILLAIALSPGRRSRHELPDDRMAVVIDDGVLAGALARAAMRESRLPAARVSASVSRRRGSVGVTPTSGSLLSAPSITHAVEGVVASLEPRPALRVGVAVNERGVVGS